MGQTWLLWQEGGRRSEHQKTRVMLSWVTVTGISEEERIQIQIITETYPKCCILHGPGGEGIMDVVPRGMGSNLSG